MLDNELAAAGFYLSGHPLDDFGDQLVRFNVMRWGDFAARVARAWPRGGAARRHGHSISRTARRNPAIVSPSRASPIPPASSKAVIFADTLAAAGDKLEPGKNVLIQVEGEAEGEAVKVRVQTVQTLDEVLGKGQRQLSITATEWFQIADLMKHVSREGSIELKLVVELREASKAVEFVLGNNFSITARQLSALKTLPGILHIG